MPTRPAGCGAVADVPIVLHKTSRKLREVVRDLNKTHNVGLILPDPTSSPSQRFDEEYRRCSQICDLLAHIIAKDDGTLQRVRTSFVHEVKAESQKWVVISSSPSNSLPRAETAGEKLRLQEVLLELLQRCVPANQLSFSSLATENSRASEDSQVSRNSIPSQTSRRSRTSQKRPESREPAIPVEMGEVMDVETPPKGKSKRPSDEELSPSECAAKKRRGKASSPPRSSPKAFSALDQVPRRRRAQTDNSSSESSSSFKTPNENKPAPIKPTVDLAVDAMSDVEFGDDESDDHDQPSQPPPPPPIQRRVITTLSQRFPPVGSQRPSTATWNQGPSVVPQKTPRAAAAVPCPNQNMPVRPRHSITSNGSTDYHSVEEIVISSDDDEPVPIARPSALNTTPRRTQQAVAPPSTRPQNLQGCSTTPAIKKTCFTAAPLPTTPSRAQAPPRRQFATPRTPRTPARPPVTPSSRTPTSAATIATIHKRLQGIWPTFPGWLHEAPLAVAWEMMRIGVHCKVDLNALDMHYNPEWATPRGIEKMWEDLKAYDKEYPLMVNDDSLVDLRFKSFPAKPADGIFAEALKSFEFAGNTVVMVASLDYAHPKDTTGPLFVLDMKPLKLEKGCRLTRRFGADRFLEILIASPTSYAAQHAKIPGASEAIIHWLSLNQHPLAGREWRPFYTKSAGFRNHKTDDTLLPASQAAKKVQSERIHLFAEDGVNFKAAPPDQDFVVPVDETMESRTRFSVMQMLNWLLQIDSNMDQPYLKLFSRISLGLTKTTPAITFRQDQFIHQEKDLVSPAGNVMNDGIGRMSLATARRLRDALGLPDIPSAVQGRIGSAKGMWIRDVDDDGCLTEDGEENFWIETFPSQRKWICDFEDPLKRTLEVKDVSRELSSGNLNLQFLPVLEDRAIDRDKMRKALGDRLRRDLAREFEAQDNAFTSPIHFKQWLGQHFSTRKRRVAHGHVAMIGGMPESKEEEMHMMLDSGFVPKDCKYMTEATLKLQQNMCDELRTKMKITVGCSAYVYMCVDFTGKVPEGEVHLAFSNKFRAEDQDLSFTLLTGCDVLVARAPAHFPSDVQRVKAVFRPELHVLRDVIIFPAKGNVALADKLSGGDYDGDLAWVCWDQEIVENFENAEVPEQPDLSKYITKEKTTFRELVAEKNGAAGAAMLEMIKKSFQFAMLPDFLGICTNYKEKLCYHRRNVNDDAALILSSLVGQLVDASKQGIIFTNETWRRLQKDCFQSFQPPDPAYKTENWDFLNVPDEAMHIIDYLKFRVGIPAITHHLNALKAKLNPDASPRKSLTPSDEPRRNHYDPDLTKLYNNFDELAKSSTTFKVLLAALKASLAALFEAWQTNQRNPTDPSQKVESFNTRVARIYPAYQAITLKSLDIKINPTTAFLVSGVNPAAHQDSRGSYLVNPDDSSTFALLKASTLFRWYYNRSPSFVWAMAGRQLCVLKALATNGGSATGGHLSVVVPSMYAAMGTDQKYIKQYLARREGDANGRLGGWVEEIEGDDGLGGGLGQREPGEYDGY